MIDTSLMSIDTGQMSTLVYLPSEDLNSSLELMQQLPGEHFVVYSPSVSIETQRRNVSIYPLYPNVAKALVDDCLHGAPADVPELSRHLWPQVGTHPSERRPENTLTAA